MSRPKSIMPTQHLNVKLPLDKLAKLNAHLFSEIEGRVPMGAYQAFFIARIDEHFGQKHLDLAAYVKGLEPDTFIVSGNEYSINLLDQALRGDI